MRFRTSTPFDPLLRWFGFHLWLLFFGLLLIVPIPGVDAEIIFKDVTAKSKERCGKTDLLDKIRNRQIEVLTTVGAGDIDTFVQPIKDLLRKEYEG